MSDSAPHRHAADRHEVAAANHERAARFWESRGDSARAALQQDVADYERGGAELERRWVELIEPETALSEVGAAEHLRAHTRQGAKRASGILMQLARELERSAGLAEEHAQRQEEHGRTDDASKERQAGQDAREAAKRARSQAEQWLELLGEREAQH